MRPVTDVGTPCFDLYENTRALPIVRPVRSVVPSTAATIFSPEVVSGDTALIDTAEHDADTAEEERSPGTCKTTSFEGDSYVFECDLRADKWVVIGISYSRNWEARIDENPTAVHKANRLSVAVKMPKGTHEITLTYRQPGLVITLIISLTVSLLCIAAALFGQKIPLGNLERRRR
jgi:hypothetical protein